MFVKYKIPHGIVLLLILTISIFFGQKYNYSDIKDILSTLQNISAMIFTIAGIWLTYIYPKAIAAIVEPSKAKDFADSITAKSSNTVELIQMGPLERKKRDEEAAKDIDRITMIVKTIIISAFVIFAIVTINVTKPIFSSMGLVHNNVYIFSRIACFLTISLVYLQAISLFSVIASNVIFLNDIHNAKNENELNQIK